MSYSNYSTYLKYKNCCRPIGDTGPPGSVGPTGPAGPTIRGNKGEILYFSETDILVSTSNVFIQEGNVTINNNLVVTGNLSMDNNFINDVSGIYFSDNTYIGHGSSFDITTSETLDISASGGISVTGNLTLNDATTFQSDTTINANLTINADTTIDSNLSMDDNFINDVSGIYFSDNTYIGHGTSFDITTSETLDISAAGGISVTGNLTINNATTIDASTIIKANLSMDDNFINDVSGIYFSDGTYIGHGSSFDITTPEILDISASGGISVTGNLTVNDAATFKSDTTITGNLTINGATTIDNTLTIVSTNVNNGNLIFGPTERISSSGSTTVINSGGLTIDAATTITGNLNFGPTERISSSGSTTVINTGGLTIDAATTITGSTTIHSSLDVSGNLSINNNFINDVSGIHFTNGTYIGNGSSFDIITPERLDISAAGGVTLTGNLNINGANKRLQFNNDNTYITSNIADDILRLYGNSIFMEASVNGNFIFTGNSNNVDLNFLTQNVTGFTINYNDSDDKIRFNTNDFVIDNANDYIGIQTDTPSATLEVNGNAIINGNLSMNNHFINDVSGIIFTQGNLLFSDFSSSTQQVQLPSSQGQPISLERKTLFYDDNFSSNILGSSSTIIDFTNATTQFNQLKLILSGNVIQPSPDISGQYVEIYANFDVSSNTSPNKIISFDISSVSGVDFLETIDVRSINKQGRYYITFGPHIFIPSQLENTTGFNFIINNETSNSFYINKYKLMFKSYFM